MLVNQMKNISLCFILSLFLLSCQQEAVNKEEEVPNALKEDSELAFSIESNSRGKGDLVEKLYNELLENSERLKNIELQTDLIRKERYEVEGRFEKYNSNSTIYYSQAKDKISNIRDSTLKKELARILEKSEQYYQQSIAEWKALLEQANSKAAEMEDRILAMKIMLTLPILENYQKKQLPEASQMLEILQRQKELIKEIEKIR